MNYLKAVFVVFFFLNFIQSYSYSLPDSTIFELTTKKKTDRFKEFNYSKKNLYYYRVVLYSDSTFSYHYHKLVEKGGSILDTLTLTGRYKLIDKKNILFSDSLMSGNNAQWILKSNKIIIHAKGRFVLKRLKNNP